MHSVIAVPRIREEINQIDALESALPCYLASTSLINCYYGDRRIDFCTIKKV